MISNQLRGPFLENSDSPDRNNTTGSFMGASDSPESPEGRGVSELKGGEGLQFSEP